MSRTVKVLDGANSADDSGYGTGAGGQEAFVWESLPKSSRHVSIADSDNLMAALSRLLTEECEDVARKHSDSPATGDAGDGGLKRVVPDARCEECSWLAVHLDQPKVPISRLRSGYSYQTLQLGDRLAVGMVHEARRQAGEALGTHLALRDGGAGEVDRPIGVAASDLVHAAQELGGRQNLQVTELLCHIRVPRPQAGISGDQPSRSAGDRTRHLPEITQVRVSCSGLVFANHVPNRSPLCLGWIEQSERLCCGVLTVAARAIPATRDLDLDFATDLDAHVVAEPVGPKLLGSHWRRL